MTSWVRDRRRVIINTLGVLTLALAAIIAGVMYRRASAPIFAIPVGESLPQVTLYNVDGSAVSLGESSSFATDESRLHKREETPF